MQRRNVMALIAAATGCALIGIAEFRHDDDLEPEGFEPADIAFLGEVAETIIPRTDTPGAKDAKVGEFIAAYSVACYAPRDLVVLKGGIAALDEACRSRGSGGFLAATPAQREVLLLRIDREARDYAEGKAEDDPPHYFTLMKQLTLLGFFTSEPGATQVVRYVEIPGPYKGDVPYRGEGFWAWA